MHFIACKTGNFQKIVINSQDGAIEGKLQHDLGTADRRHAGIAVEQLRLHRCQLLASTCSFFSMGEFQLQGLINFRQLDYGNILVNPQTLIKKPHQLAPLHATNTDYYDCPGKNSRT